MSACGDHDPPAAALRRELDVRSALRRGREPYGAIMDAVGTLAPEAVFRLVTTFDPVPLHRVMFSRGYVHHTRQVALDHFVSEYWRLDGRPGDPPGRRDTPDMPAWPDCPTVDVRGLAPPDPLERTLVALDALTPGTRLRQINERVPVFLLRLLDERGYRYEVEDQGDRVVTEIWMAS